MRDRQPGGGLIGAWVAVGGGIGAVLRVLLSTWVGDAAPPDLPWGTFAVNVTGSAALGFISRVLPPQAPLPARAFLTVGLCGGYTTFSAFDVQVFVLLQAGRPASAALYALGSALCCIAAVVVGSLLARGIRPAPA
jgi:fluoride exporter